MSHSTRYKQAHNSEGLVPDDRKRSAIRWAVPIDELRNCREDVVELYAATYKQLDDVSEGFADKSDVELRDWAYDRYHRAIEYDPHERITDVLSPLAKISKILNYLPYVAIFFGVMLGVDGLRGWGNQGLTVIVAIEGLVSPTLIGAGIVYLYLLNLDTLAHNTLARELRVGYPKLLTRRRAKVVGYGIWNRSLHGQKGLVLVTLFLFLRSLPRLPLLGRFFEAPHEYVKGVFVNNVEMIYETDGYWKMIANLRSELNSSDA